MRFEVVVFDYDGTLVNDLPLVVDSYHEALREAGFPVAREKIVRAVSLPPSAKRRVLLGEEVTESRWEEILRRRRRIYRELAAGGVRLFPDTREVLGALARRFRLGLVSNTFRELFEAFFPQALARLFAASLFYGESPRPKPSPEALQALLARLGAGAERAVFVGDAVEDMAMAHGAGVCGYGVLTGFSSAEELRAAGAAAVLPDLAGIAGLLLEERKKA